MKKNNVIYMMLVIVVSQCIGDTMGASKLVLTNELEHKKYLAVRCRTKDDHLGDHYLAPGRSKEFEFNNNVWKRTLFWCRMWKGPDYKIHQVFDAYRSKWKKAHGPTYFWIGREDGIYFREEPYGEPPVKRHDWNLTAP